MRYAGLCDRCGDPYLVGVFPGNALCRGCFRGAMTIPPRSDALMKIVISVPQDRAQSYLVHVAEQIAQGHIRGDIDDTNTHWYAATNCNE